MIFNYYMSWLTLDEHHALRSNTILYYRIILIEKWFQCCTIFVAEILMISKNIGNCEKSEIVKADIYIVYKINQVLV